MKLLEDTKSSMRTGHVVLVEMQSNTLVLGNSKKI